jgi:opacity protein-like surface antigen
VMLPCRAIGGPKPQIHKLNKLHRCGHDGQRKRVAHMPTATTAKEDSSSKLVKDHPLVRLKKQHYKPHHNYVLSFHAIKTGFVIGAGAEYMWSRNLLLRAEYLFYDFNDASRSAGVSLPAVFHWDQISISVVRLGASYKF